MKRAWHEGGFVAAASQVPQSHLRDTAPKLLQLSQAAERHLQLQGALRGTNAAGKW